MKYIKKIIEKETELSIKFNNKSLTPTNIPPLGQKRRNNKEMRIGGVGEATRGGMEALLE